MCDTNDQDTAKGRLSLRPAGGRLELGKTVDAGSVRQSFSHGRTKTVQVEVVKKRVVTPGDAVRLGANILVVGRPITESPDPGAAARAIRAEMTAAQGHDA